MKKIFPFIILFLTCIPLVLHAQEESQYLAGAVPEVEGKVVFSHEFNLSEVKQDDIYERMLLWVNNRMKETESGQVVYQNKELGQIVAIGKEYLVFSSTALSLDRSIIDYQLSIFCHPGKCVLKLEKIRFTYQVKEKYTAEEWITDKYALNKAQTKIIRGVRKFRIKTVDFTEAMFDNAREALGIAKVVPLIKEKSTATIYEPLIKTEPATTTVTPVITPIEVSTAAIPAVTSQTSSFSDYRQISPDRIPGNIIKMLNDDWMLITAGQSSEFNMMTASWGGLGMLYGKPVATCFINPTRHTFQLMDKGNTYTLTFYTEVYREALQYCGTHSGKDTDKVKGSGLTPITTPDGAQAFSEAWLIIECRKLISQSLNTGAITDESIRNEWSKGEPHKMFIGEIIKVWVK